MRQILRNTKEPYSNKHLAPKYDIEDHDIRNLKTGIQLTIINEYYFSCHHHTQGGIKSNIAGRGVMKFIDNNQISEVSGGSSNRIESHTKRSTQQ